MLYKQICLGSALILSTTLTAGGTAQEKVDPVSSPPKQLKFSLTVTGLDKENASHAESALLELRHPVYECTACKVAQAIAGTCKGCGAQLAKSEVPVLQSVTSDAKTSTLTFGVAVSQEIRLSEIESTLKSLEVMVARDELKLPQRTHLILDGVANADAESLTKSLENSRLFRSVAVTMDPATKVTTALVSPDDAPVTLAEVTKLLMEQKAKVKDLAWKGPEALRSPGG